MRQSERSTAEIGHTRSKARRASARAREQRPPETPSASAPVATTGHRRDIQGLRAIAVLVVVAFHAALPLTGGFVGVDVFFVISGYVITAMLVREWAQHGRIRFVRFYIRRFRRLTPALAVMIVVTLIGSTLLLGPFGPQELAANTAVGAVLLVANFVIAQFTGGYFDVAAETNPLLHTWSLSVEEQFYLAFPALLGAAWALGHRLRHRMSSRASSDHTAPLIVVCAIAAVSFAMAMFGAFGPDFRGSELLLGFYSPFSRAWEFAAGAVIALAPGIFRVRSARLAMFLGLAGLAMIAACLVLVGATTLWPGPWTVVLVVGTMLAIIAGSDTSGGGSANPVTRALATKPMVAIGDWSYSIYLWHWPVIVFASYLWPNTPWALTLAAVASFGPALLSYRYVEEPIRKDNTLVGRRLAIAVAATLLPALALAGALQVGTARHWGSDRVAAYAAAVDQAHASRENGCDRRLPLGAVSAENCVWGARAPGTPIYLVGDSNADHFSEAVITAGERLARPVTIATTNACPFLDLSFEDRRPEWSSQNEACRTYVQESLSDLASKRAGTVIIANSDVYWDREGIALGAPGSEPSLDPAAKLAALGPALDSTIARLEAAGHHVLIAQSTPKWTGTHEWGPENCSTVAVLTGSCGAAMTTAVAEEVQGPVRRAVAERAGAGVGVWDTWTTLCPADTCTTSEGDLVRYRDSGHITVDQSRALAPELIAALNAIG
ncbi:MAG: acyltransferase family protein [Dermatophilus congolensis]|nr:acyltransferase family protein [Dermatophilus congolensis]